MDAKTPKRAHSMDNSQGLDERTPKRSRLAPASDSAPTAAMMSPQMHPWPYASVPHAIMFREMQWLEHHQRLRFERGEATYNHPEVTAGSVPQGASVGGQDRRFLLAHPPLINQHMGLIRERLVNECHHRLREGGDEATSSIRTENF
ncbi:hypothetical protein MRX96_050567 [Rhipicephalus microplus]